MRPAWLALLLARIHRQGLRRERKRLRQERAGVDYALRRNAAEAAELDLRIAALQAARRRRRFAARYPVGGAP